jgi:hypothetical protein
MIDYMNFRRCLDGSRSDERVQGDWFSMAGFLGLTVLSGGLGRVTPAVGLEGEKPLPSRYLGRA